jgi:ribonuclease-3 family protein
MSEAGDRHESCEIHGDGSCIPEYDKPREANAKYIKANTGMLAYIGDAIYEVYIRKYLIDTDRVIGRPDVLHSEAIKYVNADAQAKVMRALEPELPEDERALVRRARNKKISTKPKNADPVVYKWATAFEALAGYYFLAEMTEVLEETVIRAINIIEDYQI